MKNNKPFVQPIKKLPNLSNPTPINPNHKTLFISNKELLNQYQRHLVLLGYALKNIRHKISRLRHYLHWLGEIKLQKIAGKDIAAYYQYLQLEKSSCQVRTLNLYMFALDQFYSWCCELGYCGLHPFAGIKLLESEEKVSRNPISKETINKLYQACENKEEKVLLLLCYGCGLRASELQNVKVSDVLKDKSMILVRSGKNNKRRYVPIKRKSLDFIVSYILESGLSKQDYLFVYKGSQKSQYLLRKLFSELQERIGLIPSKYSLHHLRHSIATHLVEEGINIRLVQQFLGHSNLETTQNYVSIESQISYGNPGIK